MKPSSVFSKLLLSSAISAIAMQAAAENTASNNPVYEEIIVTAQKHSQNLQDVASAVTALKGDQLDVMNISDPFDMSDKVPGVVFSTVQGYRRTVTIRGVGNEIPDNAGTKPAVAFHVDGVFLANDYALNADMIDVERVEITRGPDGTLFGNSSTGGAINVVTKKPDFEEFSGYVDATVGNFDQGNIRAAVNVPLSDSVAIRVAAAHREHEGYTQNVYFDDFYLDDENDNTVKVQLAWDISDNFSALLQHQIYRSDTNGPALKGTFDTVSSDPRKVSHDTREFYKLENDISSLHLNWDGELFNVSGIFSYQEYDMKRLLDVDRTSLTANDPAPLPLEGRLDLLGEAPLPQFISDLKQQDESKTAEINITSNDDSSLRWVLGAFYLDTTVFSNTSNFFDAGRDGNPISQVIAGPNVFANNPDLDFINADYRNFQSRSIFGQLSFNISEAFAITAGLRHTNNEFQDERCNFNCVPDRAKISSRPANKTDNVTGKIALEYRHSDDNLLYASIATGVKPAGSNSSSDTRFFPEVFDKELVTAYEIGSKNMWWDNRVRLNAAAFYYDYEDYLFESSGIGRFAAGASNLPKAEIYGLEIEADAALSDTLNLAFTLTAMESEITEGRDAIDRATAENATTGLQISGASTEEVNAAREATAVNLTGNELAKIPDLVANIRLSHRLELDQLGSLTTTFSHTYRGEYFARVFNSPERDVVDSYNISHLNFRYQPNGAQWNAELNIQNLFDKDAISSRHTDTYALGMTSNQYLAPRTVSLGARYNF